VVKNNSTLNRVLAAIAILLAMVTMTAHAQKTAYVASEAILDRFPDAKSARSKLVEMQSSWMREIQRQEQEIAKQREDMETNRLLWSASERREAEGKLKDLESKLAAFRVGKFGANGELDQKQAELMGPVLDKIQKAIEEVAKTQKYDYVFDKSSRGLPMLYANSSYDITAFVLKRLGVDVDASELNRDSTGTKQSEDDARRNRTRRDQEPATIDPNTLLNGEQSKPQVEPNKPNN
jgi:outer membrane protein